MDISEAKGMRGRGVVTIKRNVETPNNDKQSDGREDAAMALEDLAGCYAAPARRMEHVANRIMMIQHPGCMQHRRQAYEDLNKATIKQIMEAIAYRDEEAKEHVHKIEDAH